MATFLRADLAAHPDSTVPIPRGVYSSPAGVDTRRNWASVATSFGEDPR
jgi:hypothetical protein